MEGIPVTWALVCLLAASPMAITTTNTSSSSSAATTSSDIITNLSNFLPTGTFLTFQALAPLFTNNGDCGNVEKIVTGILILIFCCITFILSFTDSITTTSGKSYYGLVTPWGLWNPQFKGSTIVNVSGSFYTADPARYKSNIFDLINGVLAVVVLSALILLTPPVTTCYYPNISTTLVKTVPILVGIIASMYFSFAPPPRRGVGYSVTGLVTEPADDTGTDSTTATTGTAGATTTASQPSTTDSATQSLLTAAEQKNHSASASPARASA